MSSNLIKTGALLALMTVIFVGVGWVVNGASGMVVALVIAVCMNAYSYWNSDSVVLRMFKAQPISAGEAPELYDVIAKLSDRAQLPMPRVYLLDSPQPNAFATGRNPANAAVCVSTGLLDIVNLQEVAGVLGHELAHVKNRDTLTMTVAATMAGAISMFANMLQFSALFGGRQRDNRMGWFGLLIAALVAPFAAGLVQMAISRSREYEADRVGAALCGNPRWLASALRKIQDAVRQTPNPQAERMPAAAHLFIINPLTGRGTDSLFTTHPATDNRIAELERLAVEWQQAGADVPRPIEIAGVPASRPSIASNRDTPSGPWG